MRMRLTSANAGSIVRHSDQRWPSTARSKPSTLAFSTLKICAAPATIVMVSGTMRGDGERVAANGDAPVQPLPLSQTRLAARTNIGLRIVDRGTASMCRRLRNVVGCGVHPASDHMREATRVPHL